MSSPTHCAHGVRLTIECTQCRVEDFEVEEKIDHPSHYGGADNTYEAIKVIDAWKLDFCLGNTVKYIARAGRKDGESTLDDLRKARWYLDHEILRLEQEK